MLARRSKWPNVLNLRAESAGQVLIRWLEVSGSKLQSLQVGLGKFVFISQ
jgi:hypothetical protein